MSPNTDITKIADKIQKLLSLAGNNPSEAEAQAALLKAQKLMAQYNIEQSQLTGEQIQYSLEIAKIKVNPRSKTASCIIADSFACKVIIHMGKLSFFGREDNAKAAKSALEYIHKVMERGMNRECREHGFESTAVAGASMVYNAYAAGFLRGLQEAMAAQTVALAVIVPQDVKDEFAKKFPHLRKARSTGMKMGHYQDSYNRGQNDGKSAMGKRSLEA